MRSRFHGRHVMRGGKRNKSAVALLLVCIFLCTSLLILNYKLKPIVRQYATSRITYIATSVINEAIKDELEGQKDIYSKLIGFEKNNAGDILALKTDAIAMNLLKSSITGAISKKIAELDGSDIAIPLGNIINSELFSGRGPRIPIKLVPLGSAKAEFVSVFTNAGINQTRHQIMIDTTVSMSVVLPGTTAACKVNTQMNIAETILVGKVPDSYTYIDDTSASILEKFNNYNDKGSINAYGNQGRN